MPVIPFLFAYILRVPFGSTVQINSLGDYVYQLFLFLTEATGVVALAVIMYGGVAYIASGTNASKKAGALRRINQAFVGILVLFGVFVILNTLNPVLTILPDDPISNILPVIPTPPPGPTTPSAGCSINPLTPLSDPLAIQMEGGQNVIWTGANPKMWPAYQCARSKTLTSSANATSVYRPAQYQNHLWEIRDRWCIKGLQSNTQSGCSALKANIRAEVCRHFGCGWACGLVASASGNAPHIRGTGIDINGINFGNSAVISAMRSCCLNWQGIPNDQWHFNLNTSCTPR